MAAGPPNLRVVHLGTDRVRVHWPRCTETGTPSLDAILEAVPCARTVRASTITGNVLVVFDPDETDAAAVLTALVELEAEAAARRSDAAAPDHEDDRADRDTVAKGALLAGATAVGLAVVATRRLLGHPPPQTPTRLLASTALGLLDDLHVVVSDARRQRAEPPPGDLWLKLVTVAVLTLSRSPVGLGLLGLTRLRAVSAARARMQARATYRQAWVSFSAAAEGSETTLDAARRPPLPARIVLGRGHALHPSGVWEPVGSGSVVPAGGSLRGGPFRVVLERSVTGEPQPRPVREPRTAAASYEFLSTPLALAAGIGVGLVTRSLSAAVTAMLLADPHPAVVGAEAAAEGASARLAREGIAVRSPHAWYVRTPDVLLVDGLRPLCTGAHAPGEQPRLSEPGRSLITLCETVGIELIVSQPCRQELATTMLAETGAIVVGDVVADVARARQSLGKVVAVVSDTPACADGLAAADFGIALTARLDGRFPDAADILAGDLDNVRTILDVARRRERAEHQAVSLSVLGSAAGLGWEVVGRPTLRRASLELGIVSLASLAIAWGLLAGSSRDATASAEAALRLVDPHPERWGEEPFEKVMEVFGTSIDGLTTDEAKQRLRPRPVIRERSPFVAALVEQLRSPLTVALSAGAGLSLLMRSIADVGLIGAVIGANATLGAVEESRVGRAVEALEGVASSTANVLRDGDPVRIPATEVVPGDVLLLSSGERVAADARVFRSRGLQVDEASLTGESLPLEKSSTSPDPRARVVLEGSDVSVGRGRAIVVAVGADTRLGATAAALGVQSAPESPLNRRLSAMLREVLPFALGGALLVVAIGVLRRRPLLGQLAIGASTAIAAVPEGLPLLARIGETAAARRLAGRNALVRRLVAIEALGRVDVACVDKTGTLTQGRLEVQVVATSEKASTPATTDPDLLDVIRVAAIASPRPASSSAGAHPTDVAVIETAVAAGLASELAAEREGEVPFDPAHAFHATVLRGRACVKGAPEALVASCTARLRDGTAEPLDDRGRAALLAQADQLAADGLRVLLVAEGPPDTDLSRPAGLVALGFLGIADGLRPYAAEAVAKCKAAGVRLIMLTGDHPSTARAIAREAGIATRDGPILTGEEIAGLTDDALDERLAEIAVVARITPLDKLRIVRSLQRLGHTVAMTGDGVNDAPALRLADVGIAIGAGGTEVARQASEVVLADDDIVRLVDALIEGRTFWGNIRRSLGYLLGGNGGELLFLVAASLIGPSNPLTARQLLAVNLGSDVLPALSLVSQEPPSRDLSSLAREGSAALEAPLRREILRRGIAISVPTFLGYTLSLPAGPQAAQGVAYASVIGCQLAQAYGASRQHGAPGAQATRVVASTAGFLLGTLVLPPIRTMLGLSPLGGRAWVLTGATAIGSLGIERALRAPLP
jgi:calcium-translocating P-type ATPase